LFVLCLEYPMLPVSLYCPLLMAPSVFSNIYLYMETPPVDPYVRYTCSVLLMDSMHATGL
jgi:hypothetical protein